MINQPILEHRIINWSQWCIQNRAVALFLSFIFTFVFLINYILPFNGILGDRDYALQVWDLWLVNESITHGHSPYFTDLQYYPVGAHLGRHVLSPGFFPITFLVKILSGGDKLYPLYTYKVIILISYALILYFSYLTLREISLGFWVSITPAVAYTFSNFFMHHIVRLHIISGFFIPVIAFFLIKLYKRPSLSNVLICALLFGCGLYFTEFTLFIYIATVVFAGAICIFPKERKLLIDKIRLLGPKHLLLASLLFFLVVTPFTYYWLASDAEPPDPREASWYSANVMGFFIPDQITTPLYNGFFSPLNSKITAGSGSYETFIGFPFLLLGIVSLFKVNQRLVRIVAVISLIFLGLSLGPTLKIFTLDTQFPMPYAILASAPPFNVGRSPVRFVAIGLFFWMIVAAYGLQWFRNVIFFKYGQPVTLAIMLLVFGWTTAEVYSPAQRQQPYVIPPKLNELVKGPIINLPLRYHDGWALLLQIFHGQPLATGYVSRNSAKQEAHFRTLTLFYEEELATASCNRFVEMGFRNIVIWPGLPDDVIFGLTHAPNCSMNVVDLR